jgi:hypothetical protein
MQNVLQRKMSLCSSQSIIMLKNTCHFPKQHCPTDICNGEASCFISGIKLTFTYDYYPDKSRSSRDCFGRFITMLARMKIIQYTVTRKYVRQ